MRKGGNWGRLCLIAVLAILPLPAGASPGDALQSARALKRLSLEELFALEITSVSKKPQKLSEAAAAVHVVTAEDIRRSGATSLPEVLRNVPGLEVARVDSRQYAITARGFNSTTANKLLVLIDGRSIYTPLFSGVFWDVQDVLFEDVERIEVIRGPGATVWGTNAVNGVINIITKDARNTEGFLITGGAGNQERWLGSARWGGKVGSDASFRVYGKSFDRDDSRTPHGEEARDSIRMTQGGFRLDWDRSENELLTVQGDLYGGTITQATAADTAVSGGNLLGAWTRRFSAESDLQVQFYYDRTERRIPSVFTEFLDTYDFSLRHRFRLGRTQEIVWGAGYRILADDVANSQALAFLPAQLRQKLSSAFLQDEIGRAEDPIHLTVGIKLEHNDYSGFEYQPSGRISWTVRPKQSVWAAISRAVRAPSRIDRDFYVPGTPPYTFLAGGPDFQSEVLLAYELGYKAQPAESLTLTATAFYNDYNRLRGIEKGPPAVIDNGLHGNTRGFEVESTWQLAPWWRWNVGYTALEIELRTRNGATDATQVLQEGDSPRNQLFVRSLMNLPENVEADVTVRYVDDLPHQQIPAYWAWNLRLAWSPTPAIELEIVGQNLTDPRHPEFGPPATRREIDRSVYGGITCRF